MTSPIRVLHLITGLNTGGAEIALLRLLTGLDKEKFESRVVSIIPIGTIGEKIQMLGIPVLSLDMSPGKPDINGLSKLVHLLRQFQPNILQTWLYHADLLGLLAAKLAHIPVVVWNIRSAEMDFTQYNRFSGLVMRTCAFLSNMPTAVVVNSRAGQQVHSKAGYHPKEWKFIPNGIDVTHFSPNKASGLDVRIAWNITPDHILVGQVGRLDPQKDHENFLKAAAIVQAMHPKVFFVCVGEGPENFWNEKKTLARNLGLTNLIWAGPRADMSAVYNAMDVLVSSSKGEGFPNAVAEAMACGIPCVVTEVGDSSILIGETGISVAPGDSQALAENILRMLDLSDSDRINLGAKARRRIEENFSLDKMVGAYTDLYEQLS
jgi:glycosyltransferase involved in cell wall biosynthesis